MTLLLEEEAFLEQVQRCSGGDVEQEHCCNRISQKSHHRCTRSIQDACKQAVGENGNTMTRRRPHGVALMTAFGERRDASPAFTSGAANTGVEVIVAAAIEVALE